MSTSNLVEASDLARIQELRLLIAANQGARAHSRFAATKLQCTARIAAAQDELQTLEALVELASRDELFSDDGVAL